VDLPVPAMPITTKIGRPVISSTIAETSLG
jgi:hypothetical protein